MQTTAVIFKSETIIKDVRGSSASLVSSTSSPGISTTTMRPPPPPSSLNMKPEAKIERGQEEPSSSIPDLEFDGTTVLCRVCGDKASGFHYGVHSCEGCKGFFRRSIQQKIQYRPCTKNQQCSILRINRNRCQYCRLKKCIAVGMSRDAVRFGRVPKREKARILAAMQQSSNSRSLVKTISTELDDEHRLRVIIVQAHFDTCDYTSHKIKPMLIRAREHPSYTTIPQSSACPLNPSPHPQQDMLQDFSKRFSPAIRGVVEFAKRIPGFCLLSQDDQVTLLKAGVFEVLLVRLSCMFDSHTSTMICLNGQVLKREAVHSCSNARFLMDSMFDFADRLNTLGLTDSEIGLFCSMVIIAPDRPGLRDVEFIQKIRNQLKAALKVEFSEQQRAGQANVLDELLKKMPDLRTLNQLHSDKLLAFKMTEQQQLKEQQMWCFEDDKSVSPVGSTWSMSSTDEAKSPIGSVSSTESVCTGEVSSVNDYHHQAPTQMQVSSNVRNSPLLAASLSGECPLRHRSNSGSSTSTTGSITSNSSSVPPVSKMIADDNTIAATSHLISNNVTVTPIPRFIQIAQNNPTCRISSDGSNPSFEYYEPSNPDFDRTERSGDKIERNERIKRMQQQQQTSNENSMPVLRGCLEAPPLCSPGLMMETLYRPHKKFRHSLTNTYKDSAEAEPVNTSSDQCPYSQQSSSTLSSTHSTLAKSLMSSPRMTAEEMKHTDIIHNYIMRGDTSSPSPHVSAEPTVFSPKQRPYKSVITTTNRFQPYAYSSRQDPPSPDNRNVRYQSQSPHSTSPTPQLFASPVSCNTPSPKMVELQVDIAESQPLNLSKKSPSPPPLSMKTVLPMEA